MFRRSASGWLIRIAFGLTNAVFNSREDGFACYRRSAQSVDLCALGFNDLPRKFGRRSRPDACRFLLFDNLD